MTKVRDSKSCAHEIALQCASLEWMEISDSVTLVVVEVTETVSSSPTNTQLERISKDNTTIYDELF
jgi:hypothetical protein